MEGVNKNCGKLNINYGEATKFMDTSIKILERLIQIMEI
jgi:hypothetical protein